jgi:hypothetical protein
VIPRSRDTVVRRTGGHAPNIIGRAALMHPGLGATLEQRTVSDGRIVTDILVFERQ